MIAEQMRSERDLVGLTRHFDDAFELLALGADEDVELGDEVSSEECFRVGNAQHVRQGLPHEARLQGHQCPVHPAASQVGRVLGQVYRPATNKTLLSIPTNTQKQTKT